MHTESKASKATDRRKSETVYRKLKREIALNREFRGRGEAVFLALVRTWQRLENLGREFFPAFGITDAQFNALMILWDYRERPLRQHELADLLVVNRASAGGVLARLERAGWITRKTDPSDTRARIVQLTRSGVAKLEEVRGPYYRVLGRIFGNDDGAALDRFVEYLDEIRSRLSTARTPRSRKSRRA
jgi:DNA-binding MarR family transcriptional regulator